MINYDLKFIAHCDFRFSEASNYELARREFGQELGRGEVMLFISFSEDQLVWILGNRGLKVGGKEETVLDSRRWRLPRGHKWNPLTLQNYAHAAGIHLVGFSRYEEYLKSRYDIDNSESAAVDQPHKV